MSDRAFVLVVDDMPSNRYFVRRILERAGHAVREGASGAECLRLALDQPDVIVLDVMLPDMLGFDVSRRLKTDPATAAIPILQLSASFTDSDSQAHGLEAGADAYLTQPVEPQVLQATVGALLRLRQAERQREELLERERLAREEARASAARFRTLVEAMPQLVWTARADGALDFCNQHWREYADETAGRDRDRRRLLHPDDAERVLEAWCRCVDAGSRLNEEGRLRRLKDGAYRWHLFRAVPLSDEAGRVSAWFGTATDIHDQKTAIEERTALVRDLELALRSRDDFLAMVSHDLRSPLNAVSLVLQTQLARLERGIEMSAEQMKLALRRIDRQVRSLVVVLDDLLHVSRMTAGELALTHEELDLVEMLRELVGRYRETAARHGSEVRLCADGPILGAWDRARLEQLFGNLVTNALKYGGGKPIEIRLSATVEMVEVEVRDQGIGIGPEDQRRVFERFERATQEGEGESFGLGLWIARRITEAMGGEISVQSTLGKGSAFTVRLPRAPAPPSRAAGAL